MTALASERNTVQLNTPWAVANTLHGPVAGGIVLFLGALVGINGAGFLEPAAAGLQRNLKIVGKAEETVDNRQGLAGAQSLKVSRGIFKYANSTGLDALTQADEGRACFAADDQTLARTSALGTRPLAGRVLHVSADTVIVDTTEAAQLAETGVLDLLLPAGADLSAKAFFCARFGAGSVVLAGAGQRVHGILQNNPANGAIAIVRRRGLTRAIAGGPLPQGADVASDTNGKVKPAVLLAQATGAASYAFGVALTSAAADLDPIALDIDHCGILPTAFA